MYANLQNVSFFSILKLSEIFWRFRRRLLNWMPALRFLTILVLLYLAVVQVRIFYHNYGHLFEKSEGVHNAFCVKNVEIFGRARTPVSSIIDIISDCNVEGFLNIIPDVSIFKESLEELPWVNSASVKFSFPDSVTIILEENKPSAILWESKDRLFALGPHGENIGQISLKDFMNEKFAQLPVFLGNLNGIEVDKSNKVWEQIDILLQNMESEGVDDGQASKVIAMIRIGDRRWDIGISNGSKIMLPEMAEDKLNKIAPAMLKGEMLEYIAHNPGYILDLRNIDKPFIRYDNSVF